MPKRILFCLFLVILFIIFFFIAAHFINKPKQDNVSSETTERPDYLIVFVGDSMTEALGNSTELRQFLSEYYPGKTFDILNYGFGSTSILSLPKRLTDWTDYNRPFQPILDINFDLIIIESFGHNPLSEFALIDGLKKQNEILDEVVELIKEHRPNTKIVFLATLAPNRLKYGMGQVELSDEIRAKWAEERISYIKNHIVYANSHNIPLINVFEKSLDSKGNGKIEYVNNVDYIHPSPTGIRFISQEIADFILQNDLLTNK